MLNKQEKDSLQGLIDHQETEINELKVSLLFTWFCIIINSIGLCIISHR